MKKLQKGSFTIEAAAVIPLLLLAIGIIMTLLFYCHDKNVLEGAAGEAALIKAGRSEYRDCEELENGLFLFHNPQIEIEESEGYIIVTATAESAMANLRTMTRVAKTAPETFIRNVRKIKNITEGEENEESLSNGFE